MALKLFEIDSNKIVGGDDSSKANKTVLNLFKNNESRNLIYMLNANATKEHNFLTLDIKETINYLKQIFIKSPILWHFDLKSLI